MNNKLVLVVDGNWLLQSRQFMVHETFRADQSPAALEQASEGLADLMAQSISVLLRQFQDNITNVIFVSDNRSWRKEYTIPGCVKGQTYKGTRTLDDGYDWNAVFKSISILTERLKKLGITTANMYGVEGDDWCWWWSRKLNADGTNVLLWTSDEDVKQLVQEDPDTGAFTVWYEKSKGLVFNECMQGSEPEPEDDLAAFMAPIKPHNYLVDKLKKVAKISYVNPIEIINKKIYVGDAGDNILPVYSFNKNGKTYKATQKDWGKVIDFTNPDYIAESWERALPLYYKQISNIKADPGAPSESEFIEHAIYNRKMVWLSDTQIPKNVQSQMSNVEYNEITNDLLHDIKYNWKTMGQNNVQEVMNVFGDMPEF